MAIKKQILDKLGVSEAQLCEILEQDVREIFTSMIGLDIDSAKIAETSASQLGGSVSAMVGMAGAYSGLICVLASAKLAAGITSAMLGEPVGEDSADILDTMGEVANMTAGSFKHHFVMDGHEVRLSTPSIVAGENYVMSVGSLADAVAMEFGIGENTLRITVYLQLD